jgi:hypothetical protein
MSVANMRISSNLTAIIPVYDHNGFTINAQRDMLDGTNGLYESVQLLCGNTQQISRGLFSAEE